MDAKAAKFDEKTRQIMANQVMELFDAWGLGLDDQHQLLGAPEVIKKRHLYRLGEDEALPDDDNVLERATHLLGIADALRTYYPNSKHARARFLTRPSKKFPKRIPMRIMIDDGLSGLIRIRAHLDCTYAWDISGSTG